MSKIRVVFSIFILVFFTAKAFSQSTHWIVFKDKEGVTFNPYEYFDQRALERRIMLHLPLFTESDLPVRRDYIEKVSAIAPHTGTVSRWMNAIAVTASPAELESISVLEFVHSVVPITRFINPAETSQPELAPLTDATTHISQEEQKLLKKQIERMQGNLFIEAGINGKGVRIAVFDNGFPGVDQAPAFKHLRDNNQIIKTFDFVKNNENVYDDLSHGTKVLSCIAGIIDGQHIGLATGAEFLLARTEVKSERFKEEEYWLAAVEWADKNGADIINSSLGYTYHRYFPTEMDGKTTFVTHAANLAASKGILVINAMGNDGDKDWEVLGAPADADSVLSIGGIDPDTDFHITFSSFGPTYDKRTKPNLSAFGKAVVSGKSKIKTAFGTSFSTPLITGFAACALQLRPNLSNMELFRELEKSGHLYPYYDYAHGYGVPQAGYFLHEVHEEPEEQFMVLKTGNTLSVMVLQSDTTDISVDEDGRKQYLYYNIKNSDGIIEKYALVLPYQERVIDFRMDEFNKGQTLTIHYQGYTREFNF